jgi:hypothetical protein
MKTQLNKQVLAALNTSPQKKAAEQKRRLVDIAKKQKQRKPQNT